MNRVLKIIIALLLVGAISTTTIKNAEASGAEGIVEIVGGSIAAGGIGAALSTVFPPAMIILGLVMVGQGIDIALTEASEAEGKTKLEFIQSKFEDFCNETKQEFETTCNNIVAGTKVLESGAIVLGLECTKVIAQFLNNLNANGEIALPADGNSYVMLGNFKCPVIGPNERIDFYTQNGRTYYATNTSSSDYYACFCYKTGGVYVPAMLTNDSYFHYVDYYGNRNLAGGHLYGLYYVDVYNVSGSGIEWNVPIIGTSSDMSLYIEGLNGDFNVSTESEVSEDSFVSDSEVDTTILNPSQGYNTVINPGLTIPGLQNGNVGTVGVKDYLDTLGQAINGVQNLTVAVQDLTTGIIDNVNVGAYDVTADVAVSQEAEEDTENQIATPVIDVNQYPSGEAAEQALNGLQFDLTKIFPFCIPFDIVHIIQKFDVARQIPHIQISLPLPGTGETLDLDLDLAPFDGVATVLRTMELIAFVVGLAMVTRGLIRG